MWKLFEQFDPYTGDGRGIAKSNICITETVQINVETSQIFMCHSMKPIIEV